MKLLIAAAICFGIGLACGRYEVPLPAPNHWVGVAAIVVIYLGYIIGASR